jgi:serine/threonine protein kinase
MFQFRPYVGMHLGVGRMSLEFVPHPLFPYDSEAVFVLEGGEALIYQVRGVAGQSHLNVRTGPTKHATTSQFVKPGFIGTRHKALEYGDALAQHDVMTNSLYALKVMKPAYRSEHLARVAETVGRSAHIPGFHLHNRICLTATDYPDLIETYPDLEYAVLMPWLTGKTWSGFMLDRTTSANYTLQQASTLAVTVAKLLLSLESAHLAHSDIAGGNILLSPDRERLQLLDIEGLYIPGVPQPPFCSQGTPGYQHHNPGLQGQWRPEGDRFAGAILLAEMLTWWNPRVRAVVADQADTLFQPAELQTNSSPRLKEVRKTLFSMHADLLSLLDQAWVSHSLAECPNFSSWYSTLSSCLRW